MNSDRGDGQFPETRWSRVARIRSDDAAGAKARILSWGGKIRKDA